MNQYVIYYLYFYILYYQKVHKRGSNVPFPLRQRQQGDRSIRYGRAAS